MFNIIRKAKDYMISIEVLLKKHIKNFLKELINKVKKHQLHIEVNKFFQGQKLSFVCK